MPLMKYLLKSYSMKCAKRKIFELKTLYFEPSALFKGYYEEPGSEMVEYALSVLKQGVLVGLTSLWSFGEILRLFEKRC